MTSIIIPAFNHAHLLGQALASCLRQTDTDIEILVIDDGSTDDVRAAVYEHYVDDIRISYTRINEQLGPSGARNMGLEQADGAFVMFLDADDTIQPEKVALQVAYLEKRPTLGWVFGDTIIRDEVKGTTHLASEQYHYYRLNLGGWIFPQLTQSNFIPIMAPLVRREILDGIRFDDRLVPEDWFFWMEVAKAGRVGYLPYIGGTYEHRREGRSRNLTPSRRGLPPIELPHRLNLGCGTPGTRSWHPMPGLINLDRSLGWRFQDGLKEFADASIAGITISHAAMYIPMEDWGYVFREMARVLQPGGVIRITEDSTIDPYSARFGGWKGSEPAITLTSPTFLAMAFQMVGLEVKHVGPDETHYVDRSLIQHQHGDPPDVFFIEGIKRA